MEYSPIWQDIYYTTSADSFAYTLTGPNGVIYSGRAVKMPNESTIRININKIAKDYLAQDIDTLLSSSSSTTQRNYDACADFVLKNSGGSTVETYRILYDWEYGHTWNHNNATTLSLPVNGEYISGMMKPKTVVNSGNNYVNTGRSNGDYTKEVCGRYCLLYLNARGGWDAFAYTGKCVRTDTIKQYTFDHSFNNNTPEFETGRYASEITPQWELNTGILTEAQSQIYAKQLATSNKVYLQDLEEGTIVPVVIADNSVTYKTEASENNGIITYKTIVKQSQTQVKQ